MIRDQIINILAGYFVYLAIVSVCLLIDRVSPAEAQPLRSVGLNLVYTLIYGVAHAIIVPVVSITTVVAINASGGGWIVLPSAGWKLLPAFVLYALTLDFFEYLFHRAQHRFPLLWAMHSLHHSDPAVNASTTSRHYWAEHGIKMVTIYLAAGIIFKVSGVMLEMYALLNLYNYFLHTNIRVGFGRWWMIMNSPQYHRIHHSALREHSDCNFVALFPIFDVLFGTYRQPRKGEYPPTGIDSGEQPSGLVEAIFWPVRSLWRGRKPASRDKAA